MGSTPTGRLRRVVIALAAAACVVTTTSCSAGNTSDDSAAASSSAADSGTYLALGDSVPFGYRGGTASEFSDARNFVGYPELVGEALGLDVLNAACPGETTGSFLDATAQSNGCENTLNSPMGYRTAYPLHVLYDSAKQSQLDYAVQTLSEKDDVDLVTLQVGANDAFLCQQTTASGCSAAEDLRAVGATVQQNLDRILSTLRNDARYNGQIVVVTYYALNYTDPTGVAIQLLDNTIADVAGRYGADIADGYAAFKPRADASGGDSVAAGLVLPDDVHPTQAGQQLLADAVTAVAEG
jgi:lysophospholipase L1-like esterase